MIGPTPRRLAVGLTLTLLAPACGGATAEDGPAPAAEPTKPAATSSPPEEAAGPDPAQTVLAKGRFERIGYDGTGTATLVDTGDGMEVRFSSFSVERGPALRVYLSEAPAGSEEGRYDDAFIDLGGLDAFRGDQTYAVPSGTDLGDYLSVVIWCSEFGVGFVVASID